MINAVHELADGVHQLDGVPRNLVNTYLVDDVLIDAGVRTDARRILRQLAGRTVRAHALTHAHPDHAGSSHAVCSRLGIPFWVGERDVAAAESPAEMRRVLERQSAGLPAAVRGPLVRGFIASQFGHGHPADRALREGDAVGTFTVLETPGHSDGHLAFWRESDRVLIAGDVVWNFHFAAGRPGMTEPLHGASSDPAQNRESVRRLAALAPRLVLLGHGPAASGERFAEFAAGLPAG